LYHRGVPDLSYDTIELDREYGPWEYPWRERIDRYLEATENAHPWHRERSPWGPPVAPPTILGGGTIRFIESIAELPPGTLHAKFDIDITNAQRRDREVVGYGSFTEKYERRGRRWAVFSVRWREGSGLIVAYAKATMVFPEMVDTGEKEETGQRKKASGRKADLPPISRTLTQGAITAYSEDSANHKRGTSIHTDPAIARQHGFRDSVAPGMMTADYVSEMMTNQFERGWLLNGKLSVAFVRPSFPGDTITAHGAHREDADEGSFTRRVYDVWCENQDGEVVTAGTASAAVPAGR
jgi:acyl dehydratase